jgi:excisionase family DNA binding protein
MSHSELPGCAHCDRPRTYAEAAAELGCPLEWLQRHIGELPHHRFGRRVRFFADDLALIRATQARNRDAAPAAPQAVPDPEAPLSRPRARRTA